MAATTTYVGASNMTTSTTPKTVAVTWSAGEIVVVAGGTEGAGTTLGTPTVTGLTFNLEASTVAGTDECPTYIWQSNPAAADGSGNISIGRSGDALAWGFVVWRDAGVSGAGVSATNRTEGLTSIDPTAGSMLHYFHSDWNATSGKTLAAGSGTGAERIDGTGTTTWAWYAGDWTGVVDAATNYGITSYAGMKVTKVYHEVLASAGGASVTGTAVAAFTLTATVTGQPTTLGTAAAAFTLTATVAGRPTTLATAAATFALTATAAGRPTTLATAAATFTLTATAAGTPTTLGVAAAAFTLTATASGSVGGGETGTAAAAFTLNATALGRPTTLGVAGRAYTLTATAAGKPTTLAIGTGSYGLTATATARVGVLAAAVGVYVLTATVQVGFFGPNLSDDPRTTATVADVRVTVPVDPGRTTTAVAGDRTTEAAP